MDFFLADALLTETGFTPGLGLLVEGGRIRAVLPASERPDGATLHRLEGWLAPGYVEIQVNGCGGVVFSQAPTLETIRRMAGVLLAHGVTGFLPTLITAPTETIDAAIASGREAMARLPSVLGLHLEGPHIGPARPGTHDTRLIRPMDASDLERLLSARDVVRLVTVATESTSPAQIEALAKSGITVALGHTAAGAGEVLAAHHAGATMLTHLFNAMPPMAGRDPGPVGAALASPTLHASLINDGVHVDDVSMLAAIRALGPRLALTSDATASIEGGEGVFEFGGYRCRIENGAVRNDAGALAGAAVLLDEVAARTARLTSDPAEAVRMASERPARLLGLHSEVGRLAPGLRADFNLLDPETLGVRATWTVGERL
ncbi:N-acetylglucosamine-6-phosphate deacetylase [Aureimonas sp. ME7]|uniref:N-acetylglucosamine-6-phosphate deacetylase n=1 Tax=Aureimonas sp. ME7 TaxID=2744252 RepID=UPI0015F4839F|nr:N-acetylglucosamine-6-phosphate deacetylase [Aureimonas sp. ME7]